MNQTSSHTTRLHWPRWAPTPANMIFTLIVALLFWQVAGAASGAAQPQAPAAASTAGIPYQGRLADADGSPLLGIYTMVFRLYATASGSVPLWEEQWTGPNGVKVSDGLFNVMLGSLTPLPNNVVTGNGSLWLGITVNTDNEMTPRVQLGVVPYTIFALNIADSTVSNAKLIDGAVTSSKIMTGAVGTDALANKSVTSAKIANGAVGTTEIAAGSVARDKLAADVSLVKIQNSTVSVGTNSPGWTLHQGTGGRSYTQHVTFSNAYLSTPSINVGLSHIDSDYYFNQRLDVNVANVTPQGFDVVFQTWDNSKVYGAAINWLAFGPQ